MGVAAPIIAIGSMIGSLASAGMGAYSSMASANYNAQVARNNQIVANQNASIALQKGQEEEEVSRLQSGRVMGNLIAAAGASGVNPNEGSALNVRSSIAETGELDALTIRYNANLAAQKLKYQAAQFGSQAQLDTAQGEWGAASSILGAVSSVSSKWLTYNQVGIPGFTLGNQPGNPIIAGSESVFG
jgi:hypothetical protein